MVGLSLVGNGFSSYEYLKPKVSKGEGFSEKSLEKPQQIQEEKDDKNPQQSTEELTKEEEQQVSKLEARDAEVRAHEAAHIAAGGGVVTGGASFEYQVGPDGKQYAIGGEVPIDTSEGNTPDETISKAQQIQAAAMAPADPSPTDYRVAATAVMMEVRARAEKAQESAEQSSELIKAYGQGEEVEKANNSDNQIPKMDSVA
ncbi:MAG: putative metalloprotease CJM1_0395 family protein [Campylobacterales bacterium]